MPDAVQRVLQGGGALKSALEGFIIGNPVLSCPEWEATENTIQVRAAYTRALDNRRAVAAAWSLCVRLLTVTVLCGMPLRGYDCWLLAVAFALPSRPQVELFYWHGLIPYSAYTEWKSTGCDVANPNPTKQCVALLNTITDMVGPFDPDNLCVGCAAHDAHRLPHLALALRCLLTGTRALVPARPLSQPHQVHRPHQWQRHAGPRPHADHVRADADCQLPEPCRCASRAARQARHVGRMLRRARPVWHAVPAELHDQLPQHDAALR